MDLQMDEKTAKNYKSVTQRIRVASENWVESQVFCPCCGNLSLSRFPNNRPVADFFCPACKEEVELKSKSGNLTASIADGAYHTMISRIQAVNNPNFFFMNYQKSSLKVQNFLIIPKHFFVADMIEKRKPLTDTARRAGWVGCNILLKKIPEAGKIYLIKDEKPCPTESVVQKYQRTSFVSNYKIDARGWLLDVLNCIERIATSEFTLERVYAFSDELQMRHPDNHHIKDKIRQQLQVLRDNGLVEFIGRGFYRKLF